MRYIFFVAFLFLSHSASAQDSLSQEVRSQAKNYLDHIASDDNPDLYFWALNEISSGKPDIQKFVQEYLTDNKISSKSLRFFQDSTLSYTDRLQKMAFTEASPVLLVAYLSAETNQDRRQQASEKYMKQEGFPSSTGINFPDLIHAVLENNPISADILPVDQFEPIHFFLLYNDNFMRNGGLSAQYLTAAAQQWDNPGLLKTNDLYQSLYRLSLFRAYYLQEQFKEIDPLYRPILDDPHFPLAGMLLTNYRRLDYSMYRLGYYNRSLNIIRERSLPLARYLNQKDTEFKLRIAQGSYLYYIGKIEQSKKIYLQIQEENSGETYNISQGRVFNNLAIDYWKTGEFDQYLGLQFQALEEAQNENNYGLEFNILKNLFTHYRVNKDFDSAEKYLEQAKELAKKKSDTDNLARISYLRGLLYRDVKSDYQNASNSFDRALKLISPENNYSSYQEILTTKSRMLELQKKYDEAKGIFIQMLNNAIKREDERNILFADFSKADVHLHLGQIDSARAILDTLRTKNLDALDFYQLVKARTVQARYHAQSGTPEQGIDILQPVITQIVQRSRSSGDLETGFWQVEPEYLNAFETYANLLIDNDKQEQAVEVLDQLKTINDAALYQNPLVRSKVLNEEELSRYKRLTEDLDALRKQLLTANAAQQVDLQQQIDEKSAEKNALDRKITTNANPVPVSVNYIQRRMDARERVLHITELNDTYYLAEISRTGVSFTKIPITKEIRDEFEKTISKTAAGNTDLEKLYSITKLLKINTLPDHVEKLTIIPDSYLYQLPMDILPMTRPAYSKSYGDVTYLIERYQTNYMTSLNDFKNPDYHRQDTINYAGFGVSEFGSDRKNLVPLPKAETEINDILDQLTALDDKKSFINDQATEQAFKEVAPGARLVHLATHSEVSGQDPMFSSIYFSRGPNANSRKFPGRIFAYELFELNLNNELMMLNSCESGSGSYLQGTGVVGLSRALRYAGAQSLILNLWSVNDMLASEFAVQFYKEINNGDSKSKALRKAKLHFLKTKNANPHYWGSYMLLGNEAAIVHPHEFTKHVAAASFMIFFFLLAIASSIVELLKRRKATP